MENYKILRTFFGCLPASYPYLLSFFYKDITYPDKYDDPFMEDDINNKPNPDEESWDNIPEGEDIPERIKWLEEIDGGELGDHCLFDLFVYPGYPV